MLGIPIEISDNTTEEIINGQLDIKLDAVLKKKCFDEISPEVWKTRRFDHILLQSCNAVYK